MNFERLNQLSLLGLKDFIVQIDKDKIAIYFRRWIALRISNYLKAENLLDSNQYSDSWEQIAPGTSWTNAAKKGLEGLLKEKVSDLWKGENIPGYVGEDEWYK